MKRDLKKTLIFKYLTRYCFAKVNGYGILIGTGMIITCLIVTLKSIKYYHGELHLTNKIYLCQELRKKGFNPTTLIEYQKKV